MKKIVITFSICFSFNLIAQPKFDGHYLRFGRSMGVSSFNEAYMVTNGVSPNYSFHKDKISNGHWDLVYGSFSKYLMYEADCSGLLNSFLNIVTNKDLQNKPLKNILNDYPINPNSTSSVSKSSLNSTGVDNTLVDFHFCGGYKGIYGGFHFRWYELYTESRYTSNQNYIHSMDDYGKSSSSMGISANFITNYANLVKVHHTLLFDFIGKGSFTGKTITTQHTVYWGWNQFGLYVTPFYSLRFGGTVTNTLDGYGVPTYKGLSKSSAFGLKVGIYLTNGEESKNANIINITAE